MQKKGREGGREEGNFEAKQEFREKEGSVRRGMERVWRHQEGLADGSRGQLDKRSNS
jgi:hypothetical protein